MDPRPPVRAAVRPTVQRFRPATPPPAASLLLNEQVIVGLSRHGTLIAEFPLFRLGNVYKQSGCKCAARAIDRVKLTTEVGRIKTAVKGLPPDKLARVKAILGYQTLTLTMPGSNVQITL